MGDRQRIDRRAVLRSATAAAGLVVVSACTPDQDPPVSGTGEASAPGASGVSTPSGASGGSPSGASTPSPGEALGLPVQQDFAGLPTCTTTPETGAGPFPNRDPLLRRDITEGRAGHPVQLGLRVLDAACAPVAGAVVTVWHTDHTGDYSSYEDGGSGKDEGDGTTFFRGSQQAGEDGIVVFDTMFPGWYDGRAVHIHVGVQTEDGRALATQVYFDESFTLQVLSAGVYAEFGPPDVPVAADFLAGDPASEGTQLVTSDMGGATRALLNIGVV